MAELFLKQGHADQALEIYRKVARARPNDSRIAHRLAEIERECGQGVQMSFREHIRRIVESTPGALACTVMGFDGIAIDSFQAAGTDFDLPTMMVELSSAALQIRRATLDQPEISALEEMSVSAEKLTTVMRLLNDDFFMAVVLKPGGLAGKARFLMRTAAADLKRELS